MVNVLEVFFRNASSGVTVAAGVAGRNLQSGCGEKCLHFTQGFPARACGREHLGEEGPEEEGSAKEAIAKAFEVLGSKEQSAREAIGEEALQLLDAATGQLGTLLGERGAGRAWRATEKQLMEAMEEGS
jgi:hypothetical protein